MYEITATVKMPLEDYGYMLTYIDNLEKENKQLQFLKAYYEDLLKSSVGLTVVVFSKNEEKPTFDKVFKKGN